MSNIEVPPALIAIIVAASVVAGAGADNFLLKRTAAKTECARYHPETGIFEWVSP